MLFYQKLNNKEICIKHTKEIEMFWNNDTEIMHLSIFVYFRVKLINFLFMERSR